VYCHLGDVISGYQKPPICRTTAGWTATETVSARTACAEWRRNLALVDGRYLTAFSQAAGALAEFPIRPAICLRLTSSYLAFRAGTHYACRRAVIDNFWRPIIFYLQNARDSTDYTTRPVNTDSVLRAFGVWSKSTYLWLPALTTAKQPIHLVDIAQIKDGVEWILFFLSL